MKGVVFCEFIEMVESQFGDEVVDEMLNTDLPSKGHYTSVGTYHFSEMITLTQRLSEQLNTPVADLLHAFGEYLYPRLVVAYPHITEQLHEDPFQMLMQLDRYIHVEVAKLYPDAQLPAFTHQVISDNELHLFYTSCRPMAKFAEGMLSGCAKAHDNSFHVELATADEHHTTAQFILKR